MTFDPNSHLITLKGKSYLPVQWRLVWLREQFPHGTISTEIVHLDLEKGLAVFKAHVEDGIGGIGEGHGSESRADFGDFLEKAETKALGRALAALGFGTQFASELEEGERIVDSPVERTRMIGTQGTGNHTTTTQKTARNGVQSRLNTIYVQARDTGKFTPRKGSEQADFLAWVRTLFPEQQIKTGADINEEMMRYLEEYLKDVVA